MRNGNLTRLVLNTAAAVRKHEELLAIQAQTIDMLIEIVSDLEARIQELEQDR